MKGKVMKHIPPTLEPEPLPKSTKYINRFMLAALVVLAVAVAMLLKWSFADENILTVKNSPFPTSTIASPQGQVIVMEVDYCKNEDVKGQVRMSFVSQSREVFLPVQKEQQPKTCLKTKLPILIPRDLPTDTYVVKFRVTYNLNPIKQNVVSEFQSRSFKVQGPVGVPGPAGPTGATGATGPQGEPGGN